MHSDPTNVLPGTLDLLILKALSLGRLHGYGVLLRVQQITNGGLALEQGALYPALYRLERQGYLAGALGALRHPAQGEVLRADPGRRPSSARADRELEPHGEHHGRRVAVARQRSVAPMRTLIHAIRSVLSRARFEREMCEELRLHLEHRAEDLVASGLSRADALRQAAGGVLRLFPAGETRVARRPERRVAASVTGAALQGCRPAQSSDRQSLRPTGRRQG